VELREDEIRLETVDDEALRVFLKALEIAGGPRELVRKRHLTWVPSLLEASYIVVLKERGRTEEEIAAWLGVTRQTVRLVAGADPDAVLKRLSKPTEGEEARIHVAGGLAKLAWRALKRGEEVELLSALARKEGT